MQAAVAFGLAAGLLVLAVSVLGGASLPASGLRAAGAVALFSITGLVLQWVWQSLAAGAGTRVQSRPASTPAAETGPVTPPGAAQPVPGGESAGPPPAGALLNQVLPAASPAELFEPLSPPVITANGMEE